jgi:hypothetical protein
MSSFKKNDLKRDFAVGVYLSEAENPIPPPLTHCIIVYSIHTYSHREGVEGGGVEVRRG